MFSENYYFVLFSAFAKMLGMRRICAIPCCLLHKCVCVCVCVCVRARACARERERERNRQKKNLACSQ